MKDMNRMFCLECLGLWMIRNLVRRERASWLILWLCKVFCVLRVNKKLMRKRKRLLRFYDRVWVHTKIYGNRRKKCRKK